MHASKFMHSMSDDGPALAVRACSLLHFTPLLKKNLQLSYFNTLNLRHKELCTTLAIVSVFRGVLWASHKSPSTVPPFFHCPGRCADPRLSPRCRACVRALALALNGAIYGSTLVPGEEGEWSCKGSANGMLTRHPCTLMETISSARTPPP